MRKSPLHGNRAGSSGLSWPTRRHTCRPYLLRTILHGIHTHTHTLGWLSSSEKRGFVTMEGGGSRVGQ